MVEKECNKLCNFFIKNISIFRRKIDFSELQLGPSRATLNLIRLQNAVKCLFLAEKQIFLNKRKTERDLQINKVVNKTTECKQMN